MERRYGARVEIATTYDTEVEDEPSEDEPSRKKKNLVTLKRRKRFLKSSSMTLTATK